jgi:RNA-directed DNA polymerase
MVERRIADTRVLRLIRKWLNAGVIENGEWSETTPVQDGHFA